MAVSPHFKSKNSEIWRECTDPGHPPAYNFVKKIAQGDLSLGENFYQKFEIFAIFSYLSPYFYTDNVKISQKRTDRFRNVECIKKNFTIIAQGACRYCLREVMHIDF